MVKGDDLFLTSRIGKGEGMSFLTLCCFIRLGLSLPRIKILLPALNRSMAVWRAAYDGGHMARTGRQLPGSDCELRPTASKKTGLQSYNPRTCILPTTGLSFEAESPVARTLEESAAQPAP